jgi:glycosyltransferase involved in cell wall biosynthesis
VIEKINLKRQDFIVVVAGTGPKSEQFLSALETRVGAHRISNYHEVEPQNMGQIWNQIGVLLSCPQAESFGRTLREAISFGVPIWISPTSGGLEFTETLKSGYFQVLEPVLDVEKLAQQFLSLSKIKIDYDSAKIIVDDNNSFTRKLIDSWLKLAEI